MAKNDPRCPQWAQEHDEGATWAELSERYDEGATMIRKSVRGWRKALPSGVPSILEEGIPVVDVLDPHVVDDTWLDRLYENAKDQARLRMEAEKSETVYHVRINETKPIMYVWTADWHLLDGGTDHDLFDSWMDKWTTTDGLYFGIGGDLANWFSPAVLPKAMPSNTVPSDYTEPIVKRKVKRLHGEDKRVLFGVVGNHDEFPGATGWHPVDNIYRELGIPNLGPGGNVHILLGKYDYTVAARHSFNFNSSVNDTNSMRNLWIQAGCPKMVCTAHLHRPTMHMPTFDGVDTVWMRNGTPKRNDHHAKSKNFQHTRPEAPDQNGVILFPDSDHMIPFRNFEDGLATLQALREEYRAKGA